MPARSGAGLGACPGCRDARARTAPMNERGSIVLQRDRHLKWRAFDALEVVLMVLCGVAIAGFSLSVAFDIVTRTLGVPWLWLQEVTSAFFIYGSFFGLAVATRRADHLMLSAITEAMTGATPHGGRDLQSAGHPGLRPVHGLVRLGELPARLRQLPHAVADPARLVVSRDPDLGRLRLPVRDRAAGQRLAQRLPGARAAGRGARRDFTCDPGIRAGSCSIMAGIFLGLGYLGVPVPFAIMAGVFVATMLTPVSMPRWSASCSTASTPRRCSRCRSSCWSAS